MWFLGPCCSDTLVNAECVIRYLRMIEVAFYSTRVVGVCYFWVSIRGLHHGSFIHIEWFILGTSPKRWASMLWLRDEACGLHCRWWRIRDYWLRGTNACMYVRLRRIWVEQICGWYWRLKRALTSEDSSPTCFPLLIICASWHEFWFMIPTKGTKFREKVPKLVVKYVEIWKRGRLEFFLQSLFNAKSIWCIW